ncbi:DnaJ domain-containing protein [Synechocystis sp. LKSZ1]|uniref:DnaJ domain-containing protein n=1 Tax=Synechocystis sp. LKSZ1 TaxID=3144951 RepID=UPI00336C1169
MDFPADQGFVVVGASSGYVMASQVGGIGVIGGFGGIALGTPVIVISGAIVGAAVQGILEGIESDDVNILGVTTVGSVLGAGFSAAVGNVGVGVAGTAFSVGMGTMAVTGGIFALGVYQLLKKFVQQDSQESIQQIFARMEDKILDQEFYYQAMLELDPVLGELAWKQKITELELEEELQQLKANVQSNLTEDNDQNYQWQSLDNQQDLEKIKQHLKTYLQNSDGVPQLLYDLTEASQPLGQLITHKRQKLQWQAKTLSYFDLQAISAVAITKNNRYLFSGDSRGMIKQWDLVTHQAVFSFIGNTKEIQALVVSPDSQKLLAGGFHGHINAWHLEKRAIFPAFYSANSALSHQGIINALAISPDGQWLASGSSDHKIKIWNTLTGTWERTLNDHSNKVTVLAFNRDGRLLASGSEDNSILLWDTTNYQKPLLQLDNHHRPITGLKFLQDFPLLISSDVAGTIQIFDTANQTILKTINSHEPIFSLDVNSSLGVIATANYQAVKLWDLETGECLQALAGRHPITFSEDGQILVSGSLQQKPMIKLWQCSLDRFNQPNESDDVLFDLSQAWWQILGVDPDADPQSVKLAYYHLAKQFHPDQNATQESVQAMQAINHAYRQFRQQRKY